MKYTYLIIVHDIWSYKQDLPRRFPKLLNINERLILLQRVTVSSITIFANQLHQRHSNFGISSGMQFSFLEFWEWL